MNDTPCPSTQSPTTPALAAWFDVLDSSTPDGVLDMIAPDFEMTVLFSTSDDHTANFSGDREGLIAYLGQREQGALTHRIEAGVQIGNLELALGRVTRGEAFEATFQVSLELAPNGEGIRRLLIGRSPGIRFLDS